MGLEADHCDLKKQLPRGKKATREDRVAEPSGTSERVPFPTQ